MTVKRGNSILIGKKNDKKSVALAGAFLGFMIAGPFGAAVGAALGLPLGLMVAQFFGKGGASEG